ncbi:MAG: DNA polymerase I [Saprospiraceae bacterium]|nr:DNA polymerase I [Saprospiraceae bacterium]
MSDKKLFLLDGHALVYRAHFAFIQRPLINSKGINTSAVTGFMRTLWDLMQNQKPSHIAVAFDPKTTFRHEYFPAYKANRDAQPEDISIAMPYIRSILEAMKIPILFRDNFEADDLIGTIAKQAEKEGYTVYMVTPDKDYGQLVSENIFMYKPSRQGNGVEVLGVKEILEQWEIDHVEQVIDALGLIGDSVDNIPGIPGIGPKTAVGLLKEYGSVENVIANADKIKGKNGERIREFAEQALLSKRLATINLESPIQFDENDFRIDPMDKEALGEIFKELEFRSLALQILGEQKGVQGSLFESPETAKEEPSENGESYAVAKRNIENVDHRYHIVDTEEKRTSLIEKLWLEEEISFDTETTNIDAHQAEAVGLVFSVAAHEAYYVPIPENQEEAKKVIHVFKALLESNDKLWIGQNIKYDATLMKWYGVDMKGPYFDTMIAHYLCEPDLRHKLDYLAEAYLDYKMVPIEDLIGKGKTQLNMRQVKLEKVAEYAGEDADFTLQLKPILHQKLAETDILHLYETLEAPLINVLRDMEAEGVRINPDFLNAYSLELEKEILRVEQDVYREAGGPFNISSPKQVGEVLFERMKLPYKGRKSSSGQYVTDVDKLTEMADEHAIVAKILEYRKFSKLKSTYVDALPSMVNPRTGRVHSNFNQARAATGRLASDNPNLQNIPIRDEAGREIRKAFEPRTEDYILLSADYSQIELRLIAEISNDQGMLDAFLSGNDFHKATAAKVYNVPIEEVTAEQRRNAKTVNFSITYGAGATNLSRQLGISRKEAKELIDQYFIQFAGLKQYMEDTVSFARLNGYVKTMLGRKRELRDINSRNSLASSNAERVAVNTPIQGTAADMIKVAMININHAIKQQGLKSRMILQVHDELVFDVYKPEIEAVKAIVLDKMPNAIPGLKVPIEVGIGIGNNWLEAH